MLRWLAVALELAMLAQFFAAHLPVGIVFWFMYFYFSATCNILLHSLRGTL